MSFQITLHAALGTLPEYMERLHGRTARAATAAIDTTKDRILEEGRANIASSGMPGLAKALRGARYPRKGDSIDAAAFIWHRSNYGALFEDGGTILGRPILWLPLSTTMPKLGKRKITPSLLERKGVKLVSITKHPNKPLLGAAVRLKRSQLTKPKPSLAQLRRGSQGKGKLYTIPLFHGIKTATIKKRWDIRGIAQRQARLIPHRFASNFSKEE